MSKQRYLLDTLAVLALVENEDGAERVESLLREQAVLLPWTYATASAATDSKVPLLARTCCAGGSGINT